MHLLQYTTYSFLATAATVYDSYDARDPYMTLANIFSSKGKILVLFNFAYCVLFLCARLIQRIVFGELSHAETQKTADRLLNFVMLKVVFIGAVLSPDMNELLVWTSWFSIVGFMKLFTLLSRDRFNSIEAAQPNSIGLGGHAKLFGFLLVLLYVDIGWVLLCMRIFADAGLSVLLLLLFECWVIFVDTLQTLVCYCLHVYDLRCEGVWDERAAYQYYVELCCDSLIMVSTLTHYLHILWLHGLGFTMVDFILAIHMRVVYVSLRKKWMTHRNYLRVLRDLEERYETVSGAALAKYDATCAICLGDVTTATKLPCNHVFHRSCIVGWLREQSSCPTCRRSLLMDGDEERRAADAHDAHAGAAADNAFRDPNPFAALFSAFRSENNANMQWRRQQRARREQEWAAAAAAAAAARVSAHNTSAAAAAAAAAFARGDGDGDDDGGGGVSAVHRSADSVAAQQQQPQQHESSVQHAARMAGVNTALSNSASTLRRRNVVGSSSTSSSTNASSVPASSSSSASSSAGPSLSSSASGAALMRPGAPAYGFANATSTPTSASPSSAIDSSMSASSASTSGGGVGAFNPLGWMPSFNFEVRQVNAEAVAQLHEMFPHISVQRLAHELNRTGNNIELAANNLLELYH